MGQRSVTPLEYGQFYGYPPDPNQTGALVLNPTTATLVSYLLRPSKVCTGICNISRPDGQTMIFLMTILKSSKRGRLLQVG
jgi:hypothetical protein